MMIDSQRYGTVCFSVSFHHVLIEKGGKHKSSTTLSLLAYQFGRPVGRTHVIFQLNLPGVLPSTAKLLTEEGFLFLMDKLDVAGQDSHTPKGF